MHQGTDIPQTEPGLIIAGDTLKWKRTDLSAHYPASAWTLSYNFVSRSPSGIITITALADGNNYSISVAKATTAAYVASDRRRGQSGYEWAAFVTKADTTERYQVDSGTMDVAANVATQIAGWDSRSHVKAVLDAIEAVIAKRATQDQMGYTIAGRSLSKTPMTDLILLRDRYKSEYQKEIKAEKINNGEGTGGKVLVRFK